MAETAPRLPYAVAAKDLLRNSLLDAACDELAGRPWSEVTMSDIAGAAGVSRQTLYNEFGSRAEFAQMLVLREAGRFLDSVEQTIGARLHDPTIALQATFELFLTAAAENPLVRTIVSGSGAEELLALFTTQGETLVQGAAARLATVLLDGWPTIAATDARLLSDCLVRLAISYAALPAGSPRTTAASISTLLGPYVEQLVVAA